MTPAQRIALEHVCLLACETIHPRFTDHGPLSTVRVIVAAGYE
jgi:hypothetical protein